MSKSAGALAIYRKKFTRRVLLLVLFSKEKNVYSLYWSFHMRSFDYMFSYIASRGIYDYLETFIPQNTFIVVILLCLALYILSGRR